MKPRTVELAVLFTVAALSATVWLARYSPWVDRPLHLPNPVVSRLNEMQQGGARREGVTSDAAAQGVRNPDPAVEARPPFAVEWPLPKAVAAERSFEFGRMRLGEKQSHRFRIENKGQTPLVIAKGPTECKCTISSLSAREVPPGGGVDVEVSWAPLEPDSTFEKSAIIWTNDPKLPEIRFRVAGRVGRSVAVSPTAWHAGTVAADHDGKAVGIIVSEIEPEFKILSVEPGDPNVKVSYKPMAASALARVGMLSGYEFTSVVGNGIPIGNFRSRLKVLTSFEPKTPLEVDLTAVRPGPIRLFSAVNSHWDPEKALLNLGRFRHEVGFKTTLSACVYDMRGEFRVRDVKSTDSFVTVSLEPNQARKAGEQQLVRFLFEVLPGSPPVNYFTQKPAHVTVLTNHPMLEKIDFDLQFVSM
jgi:Protein of unknown function (DUF1573)